MITASEKIISSMLQLITEFINQPITVKTGIIWELQEFRSGEYAKLHQELYYYKLSAAEFSETKKMMLLK